MAGTALGIGRHFDNGHVLGSSTDAVCQIDSLAQSWAVISGEADPARCGRPCSRSIECWCAAKIGLVLLFTPPFDDTELEPGYIKGYLPGIRENGGQYTHAALWVAKAWALLDDADKAYEIIDILNPIRHAATREDADRFRLEPYAIPADVYSQPPHVGRGGWSWYTGSASWYYRVVLEDLLGFELRGDRFRLRPRLPSAWPAMSFTIRRGQSTWRIEIRRAETDTAPVATFDDEPWQDEAFSVCRRSKRAPHSVSSAGETPHGRSRRPDS